MGQQNFMLHKAAQKTSYHAGQLTEILQSAIKDKKLSSQGCDILNDMTSTTMYFKF